MKVIIHLEIKDEFYNEYEYAIDNFYEHIMDFCTDIEVEEIGE